MFALQQHQGLSFRFPRKGKCRKISMYQNLLLFEIEWFVENLNVTHNSVDHEIWIKILDFQLHHNLYFGSDGRFIVIAVFEKFWVCLLPYLVSCFMLVCLPNLKAVYLFSYNKENQLTSLKNKYRQKAIVLSWCAFINKWSKHTIWSFPYCSELNSLVN